MFSGKLVVSQVVKQTLSSAKISQIIRDLFLRIRENKGVSNIQIFVDEKGRKIVCIDQFDESMLQCSDGIAREIKETDFWTMEFSCENGNKFSNN